jgi:ribosomal protein S18 acetylase RimI-like enzyme
VSFVNAFGEKTQLFTKINGHSSRFAVESQQFLISPLPFLPLFFKDQIVRTYLKHDLKPTMIRLTTPDDTNKLLDLAEATGLFEPNQIEELDQMLDQYFSDGINTEGLWFTDDENELVGVVYVAPERMTEGTWNLYLIAVHPDYQRKGRGAALLNHVEQMLAERGERVLLVETSGLEDFEYVRIFYRKSGYEEEARIREFYKAGDDKIIFRKALRSVAT